MKPLYLIDFRVKKDYKSSEYMMKMIRALHSFLSAHPGKTAIAFPNSREGELRSAGNVARIFSEKPEILENIADFLANQDFGTAFSRSMVSMTPSKYNGVFEEFLLTRVPSARSIVKRRGHLSTEKKEQIVAKRLRVMEEVEELPFISMSSKSQDGAHFSLHFSRIQHTSGNVLTECSPSNYGLSLPSRRFSLPKLPLLPQMTS